MNVSKSGSSKSTPSSSQSLVDTPTSSKSYKKMVCVWGAGELEGAGISLRTSIVNCSK